MERALALEPHFQLILEEFRQVTQREEVPLIELYLLFLQVAGESFDERQAFFNRFALSEGKVVVLGLLKASGQMTPSELAQAAGVTPGTITGLLAGLERSGLIHREEHPQDGRKVAITLAPGTLAFFEHVLAQRSLRMEELLASFTLQEQQQLHRLLSKLHNQLLARPSS